MVAEGALILAMGDRFLGFARALPFVPMTNFGGRPFVWLPQRTLYEFDATTAPIPEPGTLALFGLGLLGLGFARRRLLANR